MVITQQEIQSCHEKVKLANREVLRYKEETQVYKKQIEKVLKELEDKSDTESFDEDKQKILNVQRELEAEQLKEKLKIVKQEIKMNEQNQKEHQLKQAQNLKFSQESNKQLKQDYEMMQEKFERQMKVMHTSI